MAAVVVEHYAHISAAQLTDPTAMQAVLHAVQQHVTQLPAACVSAAAATHIRWSKPLSEAVGIQQTAFLQGRFIGHIVMLLQLLPAALRTNTALVPLPSWIS